MQEETRHLMHESSRIMGSSAPADSLLDQLWDALYSLLPGSGVVLQMHYLSQNVLGSVSASVPASASDGVVDVGAESGTPAGFGLARVGTAAGSFSASSMTGSSAALVSGVYLERGPAI